MTPFQMQALAMLCAASQGGSASTNCNAYLVDGSTVTSLASLGTFAISECAGPALNQATTAVILGGDIYRLSNDTLVKLALELEGSWDSVYMSGDVGYGLRNGLVYKINATSETPTCTQVTEVQGVRKIAIPGTNMIACATQSLIYIKSANGNGQLGTGAVKSLFGAGSQKTYAAASNYPRYVMCFTGVRYDYLDAGISNPSVVMAYGNYLTIVSTSGTLRVFDTSNNSGFTPAEGTVFKSCTICKGNDVYFYAIDENSVLHRFRGMNETTYSSTGAGWTEISGDSVAYGIRNGMLYRVDPAQNNGAPQRIGHENNWIHAWPLSGGKVVALAYA